MDVTCYIRKCENGLVLVTNEPGSIEGLRWFRTGRAPVRFMQREDRTGEVVVRTSGRDLFISTVSRTNRIVETRLIYGSTWRGAMKIHEELLVVHRLKPRSVQEEVRVGLLV